MRCAYRSSADDLIACGALAGEPEANGGCGSYSRPSCTVCASWGHLPRLRLGGERRGEEGEGEEDREHGPESRQIGLRIARHVTTRKTRFRVPPGMGTSRQDQDERRLPVGGC